MRDLYFRNLKQFWDIAKLYWISNEKWGAYRFLALIFTLLAIFTPLGACCSNIAIDFSRDRHSLGSLLFPPLASRDGQAT